MKNPLHRMEIFLEGILEWSPGVFSRETRFASRFLAELFQSVDEHALPGPDGRWIAPNIYRVTLRHREWDTLHSVPAWHCQMESKLEEYIIRRGMRLRGPVTLAVERNDQTGAPPIRILAELSADDLETTHSYQQESAGSVSLPSNAFFILGGNRHIPLDQPVVSIGRHLDNRLVLEDAMVSRHHALLRAREGRYLLTDLGSKHGTRVNETPVSECFLCAGDVLRLGRTALIYGDESPADRTQPLSLSPSTSKLPSAQRRERA
jgi:hypothetical protein